MAEQIDWPATLAPARAGGFAGRLALLGDFAQSHTLAPLAAIRHEQAPHLHVVHGVGRPAIALAARLPIVLYLHA